MKQSINREQFVKAFDEAGRSENFSPLGRRKMFDYFEQFEEESGEEIEFDVIAFCCDYSESSIKEVLENYNLDSIDELRDNTLVIEVDDETIIYQAY